MAVAAMALPAWTPGGVRESCAAKGVTVEPTRPYHWYCLLGAIVLETGGTTLMKLSQSWSFAHAALLGLVLMWCAIALSYYLLAQSTTGLPVGVAFAFWEGLGLTLITLASVFILDETLNLKRLLGLVCVLVGAYLVHQGTGHGSTGVVRHAGRSHALAVSGASGVSTGSGCAAASGHGVGGEGADRTSGSTIPPDGTDPAAPRPRRP